MLLSCRKATELIEKRQICGLSRMERWKLSVHLRLCRYCRNYEIQSEQIDAFLKKENEKNVKLKFESKEK